MRTNVLQLFTYAALSTSALVVPLLARDLGASLLFIGLIGAFHGLTNVASNLVFGRLGDRVDRRRLLMAGFALSTVAFALQFFARTPGALLVVRAFVGFAVGIIPATLVAYVYDIRRPLGKFTSFNAMGWLLGSGLIIAAGWLPSYEFRLPWLEAVRARIEAVGPYEALFLASAVLSGLSFLFAGRLAPMRVDLDVPLFPAAVVRANAHVYLALFLRHVGATAIWTIFPLYILAEGGDLALVGWLHVLNMVAQILVLRNAERFRRMGHPRTLIMGGLALSTFVFVGFTLVPDAYALLPWQLLVGVSFAALWLGCQREVLDRNVERSTAGGFLNASMSLANVVGPVLGGLVAAALGYRAVMLVGAAATVAGLAVFAGLARARPPHAPARASAARPVGEIAP